jgi:ATP-dependent Lon protease
MACVTVSLATGIPIRKDVAMTGEVTLRGRVLPVGGLKEKLLAAARAGIHVAIVPAGNLAELGEIPEFLRQKIKIKTVHTMTEVLAIALARPLSPLKWHPAAPPVTARRGQAKVLAHHRRGGAA